MDSTMRCKHSWRIKVELFLDIDDRLFHALNKKTIASRRVKIEGANWEKAMAYCTKCGRLCPGLGGGHPEPARRDNKS